MVSFDSHFILCMVPESAEKTNMDVSCMYAYTTLFSCDFKVVGQYLVLD